MARLEQLLEARQGLMRERDEVRQNLKALTRQIDEELGKRRVQQLLNQFSDADRVALVQAIRAVGLPSQEEVNGG
jgi:hypothetical protein